MFTSRLIELWFLLWQSRDKPVSDVIYYHSLAVSDEIVTELKGC